jgi:ribonuclease P/MRP protein subunit RPP40
VDVLYTDFEKAFDKVSHKKLIIKLRAYGIRGKLLEWVKGFLKGRRQCVVMGDIESEWKDILSGVPQGSVLGPLLFVIYINDLPDGLKNVFKMYADDSKVIAEAVELDQISTLQEDIAKIKEWCDKWSMCLNSGKCKVMHLGNKNPVRSYYVENGDERVPLGVTEAEKDLGIMVANNGKTKLQAEKAIHKANHELGKMRKTFRFFNIKLFRILYPTYIRPQLEFASSAWNVLSKESVNKMESIQGRATKMVFELRTLSEQDRLTALGLTTLEVRRKRGDLIQLFKIMNKMEEVDIDMGMGNNISGGVGRRHGHQIQRERTGSYPMRNFSLPNRNATTWNILPQRVVNVESVNDFKTELDEHIKSIAWRRSIYS